MGSSVDPHVSLVSRPDYPRVYDKELEQLLALAYRLLDDGRSRGLSISIVECVRQAVRMSCPQIGEAGSEQPEDAPLRFDRVEFSPWQAKQLTTHIDVSLTSPLKAAVLARLVGLSVSHFVRVFRNSFGCPPHRFVMQRRVARAQELMLRTAAPLTAIALECGLADQAHLTRLFRRLVGETPASWRRAHRPLISHNVSGPTLDNRAQRIQSALRLSAPGHSDWHNA